MADPAQTVAGGTKAVGEKSLSNRAALNAVLAAAATDRSRRMLLRKSAAFGQVTAQGSLELLLAAGFGPVSPAWTGLNDVLAMPDCRLPLLSSAAEALRRAETAPHADRSAATVEVLGPAAPPSAYPPMDEALVSSVLALGFPEVRGLALNNVLGVGGGTALVDCSRRRSACVKRCWRA